MRTAAANRELVCEAIRKLEAYIASGVYGCWVQAMDRLKAADMDVSGFDASCPSTLLLALQVHVGL